MDLIPESFQRLFPDKPFFYQSEMQYNRRLSDFNANIRLHNNTIAVNLNLQWKDIDNEIKIGLIQTLLLKILHQKKNSSNIDLYHNFIRNIPLLTPKTKSDPLLENSFQRVNQVFFNGNLELPNVAWGQPTFRKLACYNYHNDTVTVSSLFQEAPPEIVDYLMYHELLHKQQSFKYKNGRSSFHSPEFRRAENLYPHKEKIDREINSLVRHKRVKNPFRSF